MVVIGSDRFQTSFSYIKEDTLGGGCTVLILVAPDADSLCACRILTTLLKSEEIAYNTKPVSSYEDIIKANKELISTSDVLKTIVMINCGGTIDIASLIDLKEGVAVYLIDSHRPLHLSNITNELNVYVFILDQEEGKHLAQLAADAKEDRRLEEAERRESGEEEESGGDEEDEDEEEERERGSRRRRTGEDSFTRLPSASSTLWRVKRDAATHEYYRGSFYGTSASMTLYDWASQLAKDTVSLLWLGIVGLADQWTHHRIDGKRYLEGVRHFQNEVSRLSQVSISTGSSSSEITFEYEYRFALLRHWSLYDSMFHSPYVACRMSIWKANGEKRLRELLALMGIPLIEGQQPFVAMNLELKQLLHERLSKYAPAFQLDEISFPSFVRSQGFRTPLSAFDVVHIVSALLEGSSKGRGGNTRNTGTQRRDKEEEEEEEEEDEEDEDDCDQANFNRAYDSLSVGSSSQGTNNEGSWDLVNQGLDLARSHLRALVRMGAWLIEKKLLVRLGPFRYVILKDSPDLPYFLHALSLTRLALFLDETMRERGKANKPFLICALNEEKGTYLIVGLATSSTSTSRDSSSSKMEMTLKKNTFGNSFKIAASRTNAKIQHHSFDSAVVEIRKQDITKFIEFLLTQLTVAAASSSASSS